MAADNFKPTLWEGALLANFHSVSIADVLATKPAEIKGQKVIFNRVAGGTLKDYSGRYLRCKRRRKKDAVGV